MSKFLKPIRQTPQQEKRLEDAVLKIFTDIIFKPIVKFLKKTKPELLNSLNLKVLETAILEGKVSFDGKVFRGSINAKISRELKKLGAIFDKRIGAWRIDKRLLPFRIQSVIAQAEVNFKTLNEQLLVVLDEINVNEKIEEINTLTRIYRQDIKEIDKKLKDTVFDVIGVEVNITEEQRTIIAREFSENLKLTIKKFTDKEIITLRKEVEENVFAGFRADSLADIIEKRFGVSKSKAKFLGLQETSLLTSTYRELRYKEVGIKTYKWSTSKDERVRSDHDDLDGKVFSFDSPPVVNKNTGKRANPSEDYGCRCFPIPIIINI